METDIRELVEETLSEWVEALSLHEISTNEPLLRAFEQFEKTIFSQTK